jgi:hypothetical protein
MSLLESRILPGVPFLVRGGSIEEEGWVEVRKACACLLGLLVNFSLLTPEPNCELPKVEGGGGSAGVKDAAEDGGGPAGVVEN